MYKQTNTICKPKRIRLFTLIINCTMLMKTNSRFSRYVCTISDIIWCNKHLRHTTREKYGNNGKGGYFRFDDDDNNMSYIYPFNPYWISNIIHQDPEQASIYTDTLDATIPVNANCNPDENIETLMKWLFLASGKKSPFWWHWNIYITYRRSYLRLGYKIQTAKQMEF